MYIYIMHYLSFFLSHSIKNLTLAFVSRLFTIKVMLFSFFTSFNSYSGLFSIKAITENQLLNSLINSRQSYKKYC